MNYTPDTAAPFGVGKIFSDAWMVFKSAWFSIFLVFIATGIVLLIAAIPLGMSLASLDLRNGDPDAVVASFFSVTFLLFMLAFGAIAVVGYGAALKVAHNVGHGAPANVQGAILSVLPKVFVLIVLVTVTSIISSIGSWFFVVPGLWLSAVFLLVVPIIAIEGRGFDALGRSIQLSKGYRWQMLGTMILGYICVFAVTFAATLITSRATLPLAFLAVGSPLITGVVGFLSIILSISVPMIALGLFICIIVSIYQRVIDLKEGGSSGAVPEVFS